MPGNPLTRLTRGVLPGLGHHAGNPLAVTLCVSSCNCTVRFSVTRKGKASQKQEGTRQPGRIPYLFFGTPGKDRTCDLRIRNPSLYPLSYGGTVRMRLSQAAIGVYSRKAARLKSTVLFRIGLAPVLQKHHRPCVELLAAIGESLPSAGRMVRP